MFKMSDVQDLRCLGCGIFGMWSVGMQDFGDVEGSVCIMFKMWDVQDMRFSGCEIL